MTLSMFSRALNVNSHCRLATTAFLLALVLGSVAPATAEPTAGVTLLEQFEDPDLNETLENAGRGIVSPDGKHLYLHKSRSEDATLSVFGLSEESNHRPFYIRSYASGCCGAGLEGPDLTITAFNPSGTIAYAQFGRSGVSANQFATWGIVVLQRDPESGALTELQRISFPELTWISGSPTVTEDGRTLFVSYAPVNSGFQGDHELRAYSLAEDTGLLQSSSNLVLPAGVSLTSLTTLESGTRLLASSASNILEYAIDQTTGAINEIGRTPIEAVAEFPEPTSPLNFSVTNSGDTVYALRSGLSNGGGHLYIYQRDSSTASLTLIDELTPADFRDYGLFNGLTPVLSQDETLLMVPSYYARYIAGSPSITACVHSFSRDSNTQRLLGTGTQCELFSIGPMWAPHPSKDLYFTSATVPSIWFPSTTQVAVWGLGRIAQKTNIHAAVLPTSRSVGERDTNETPATYFTSVLNPGTEDALQCRIEYNGELPISVRFQVNDPATNEPLNPEQFDQDFSVPAGRVKNLSLSVYQYNRFTTSNVNLEFVCANSDPAPSVPGVTSMLMSSSILPLPDLVTGSATIGNTGIVRLPSPTGTEAFAVSSLNIGATDTIRAVPLFDLADLVADLPANTDPLAIRLRICETDLTTGECLGPPAAETQRTIATDEIATYTVFAVGNGTQIPLDPARNRVFVAMIDSTGEVRGASSVAITTVTAEVVD